MYIIIALVIIAIIGAFVYTQNKKSTDSATSTVETGGRPVNTPNIEQE